MYGVRTTSPRGSGLGLGFEEVCDSKLCHSTLLLHININIFVVGGLGSSVLIGNFVLLFSRRRSRRSFLLLLFFFFHYYDDDIIILLLLLTITTTSHHRHSFY